MNAPIQRPASWSPAAALRNTGLQQEAALLWARFQTVMAAPSDDSAAAVPASMDAAALFDMERACLEMAAELRAITGGAYESVDAALVLCTLAELATRIEKAARLQAGAEAMANMRAMATQGEG